MIRTARWITALALILIGGPAATEETGTAALVRALRDGGHTIYFRHAQTDWRNSDQLTKAGDWLSCDPGKMRQLSDQGRATARRIGGAMRALGIPVGTVLSSEYCRSHETARLLGLGPVTKTSDIMNMRAAAFVGGREAVVQRARRVFAEPPLPGTNTVIVGHGNLMRAATGAYAGEAGAGIYVPAADTEHGFKLIAEVTPDDWIRLAERYAAE
jgi:broad specificity phosphatase PhoE